MSRRPRLPPPVGELPHPPGLVRVPVGCCLPACAARAPPPPPLLNRAMDRGMDRVVFGACLPGGMEAAADREGEGLELSLSLHPSPSSPPRFQAVFACCYCPRKFRSSQALGGHQNAHKLQRNLARRGREANSAPPPPPPQPVADQGSNRAPRDESAPAPRTRAEPTGAADAWGEVRHRRHQHHRLHQFQAGGVEALSSAARGDGGEAEEIIDLSLKL